MRVLIDECVDHRVKPHITGHDVYTVEEMGWKGKTNGDLLKEMVASNFDVLLTVDKSFQHQQNIQTAGVAVVLMKPTRNVLKELLPLMPAVNGALGTIKAGEVVEVGP
jgi:hypothetical protein